MTSTPQQKRQAWAALTEGIVRACDQHITRMSKETAAIQQAADTLGFSDAPPVRQALDARDAKRWAMEYVARQVANLPAPDLPAPPDGEQATITDETP